MEAKHVYIIGSGRSGGKPDGEVKTVSKALFGRHKAKPVCESAGVFWLKDGKVTQDTSQVHGQLPTRGTGPTAAPEPRAEKEKTTDTEKPASQMSAKNRIIGIYVVMHGPGNMSVKAEDLAKSIADIVQPEQRQNVHYVSLVSCGIAQDILVRDSGAFLDLESHSNSYVVLLIKALKSHQMSPVIAGWDVFITAAPYRPREQDVYAADGEGKVENLASVAGRKIVQRKVNKEERYTLVPNEYRKVHKHLFAAGPDEQVKVVLGRWSEL